MLQLAYACAQINIPLTPLTTTLHTHSNAAAVIISKAFYNFGGNITIEGVFPALEVIGAEAFRTLDSLHISINIPFGLPALQCMGPRAFALTDWQGRLAIKGDFPCLQSAAPEETDTDDDTGDYSAYNVGEKVFKQSSLFSPLTIAKYNFRVKMNVNGCKPGAIDWCTETKAVCNTIHGFASKAKCFADDRYRSSTFTHIIWSCTYSSTVSARTVF